MRKGRERRLRGWMMHYFISRSLNLQVTTNGDFYIDDIVPVQIDDCIVSWLQYSSQAAKLLPLLWRSSESSLFTSRKEALQ